MGDGEDCFPGDHKVHLILCLCLLVILHVEDTNNAVLETKHSVSNHIIVSLTCHALTYSMYSSNLRLIASSIMSSFVFLFSWPTLSLG